MSAEADAVRESIGQEQYREALSQWSAYTQCLEQAIRSGTVSPKQMNELRDLFHWGRDVVLCARAHLRDQQRELAVAVTYNPPAPAKTGHLRALL